MTFSTAVLSPACTCTEHVPDFTPSTRPVPVTATAPPSDHHVTADAPDGTFTADSCTEPPADNDSEPPDTPEPEIANADDADRTCES